MLPLRGWHCKLDCRIFWMAAVELADEIDEIGDGIAELRLWRVLTSSAEGLRDDVLM